MYGGSQGQTLFDDVWQYNLNSNMWDKIKLSNKRSNLKSDNLKNCTFCDQCETCDWRPDPRVDCLECWDCYHDEKYDIEEIDVFNNLLCGKCASCDELTFFDCNNCTSCFDCSFSLGNQKPPALKGHSLVMGQEGIILYGGVTWNDVNMTKSDVTYLERVAFLDACKKNVT